jgi:hypothetical protein
MEIKDLIPGNGVKMYYWILAKWYTLLELFGLRLTDDWFIWKAAERELGKNKADVIYTQGIALRLKFGSFPTKKRCKAICDFTRNR